MSDWKDEKTKVKEIFDAVRNFGLTGVVLYVGIYNFSISSFSAFRFIQYMQFFTGVLLTLLSIYLFWINAISFNKKIRVEYLAGNVGSLFYCIVPGVIILLGINLLGNSAFSLKLESGKSLGNSSVKELVEKKLQ
jgi:hypothetical protein